MLVQAHGVAFTAVLSLKTLLLDITLLPGAASPDVSQYGSATPPSHCANASGKFDVVRTHLLDKEVKSIAA